MIPKEKSDILLEKAIKGLTFDDITAETYHDNNQTSIVIYVVHSDEFISEYQGRIYVDDIADAVNEDGSIRKDKMLEFISEAYREYIEDRKHLEEVNPELYRLIKEYVDE